jgi:hypothetical protein
MFCIEVAGTDIAPGRGFDRNPDGTIKTYPDRATAEADMADFGTVVPGVGRFWCGELEGVFQVYVRRVVSEG